ncbi:MAG: alkaline phosphatase, partial [Atribacterota bacterium]|nr:alkaline phosphatase [Atribacterota bacterium]
MFKSKLSKTLTLVLIIVLFVTGSVLAANAPKYVFYLIGDGMGAAQRQISELFAQTEQKCQTTKLVMDTFPIAGLITTYSSDTLVTDSAAAGTALACGYKTNNG